MTAAFLLIGAGLILAGAAMLAARPYWRAQMTDRDRCMFVFGLGTGIAGAGIYLAILVGLEVLP